MNFLGPSKRPFRTSEYCSCSSTHVVTREPTKGPAHGICTRIVLEPIYSVSWWLSRSLSRVIKHFTSLSSQQATAAACTKTAEIGTLHQISNSPLRTGSVARLGSVSCHQLSKQASVCDSREPLSRYHFTDNITTDCPSQWLSSFSRNTNQTTEQL